MSGILIARKKLNGDSRIMEVVDFGDCYHVTILRKTAYSGYNVEKMWVEKSLYAALTHFDSQKSEEDMDWDREAQKAIERRAHANG